MKRARFARDGEVFTAASHDGVSWTVRGNRVELSDVRWASAVDGDVVGVALSDSESLHELAEVFAKAPFGRLPQEPVFYIKPRNTLCGHQEVVFLPLGTNEVEIGGTIGFSLNGSVRAIERDVFERVDGLTVAIDLTLPGASYFRPPLREKCFDGACPIGPWIVEAPDASDIDKLEVRTFVNGDLVACRSLNDTSAALKRALGAALEFMKFQAGDLFLGGIPHQLPRARIGDTIEVEVPGVGRLSVTLAAAPS